VLYLCAIDVILLHIICSFKAKSLLVINGKSPEREFRTFHLSHVMKNPAAPRFLTFTLQNEKK